MTKDKSQIIEVYDTSLKINVTMNKEDVPYLTNPETGEKIYPTEFNSEAKKEMPELEEPKNPKLRWGDQSGSGTYLRVRCWGPDLKGGSQILLGVQFWASSGSVWNNDGNDVKISFSSDGGSWGYTLTTLWNNLGTYTDSNRWTTFYTWTLPGGYNWVNASASTNDRKGDGRFSATSGAVTVYRGYCNASISGRGQTWNDIYMTYRSTEGEDIAIQQPNGNYDVTRPATTGSGGSAHSYRMNIPTNYAGSLAVGQIPDNGNGSSPWAWGSYVHVPVASVFASMSMPIISAWRESDPTRIRVEWTAGGTGNKPQGSASRDGCIILRDDSNTNIAFINGVNLEGAGGHTFTNCPVDKNVNANAEYTVYGLANGAGNIVSNYQGSNRVVLPPAFSRPSIKVGGTYRQAYETHIKVGGTYRPVKEIYIKVGGTYRKVSS